MQINNSKIVCFICTIIIKWQGISESLLKVIKLVNLAILQQEAQAKFNWNGTELTLALFFMAKTVSFHLPTLCSVYFVWFRFVSFHLICFSFVSHRVEFLLREFFVAAQKPIYVSV